MAADPAVAVSLISRHGGNPAALALAAARVALASRTPDRCDRAWRSGG
jgi:hypothetical protein